MPLPGTNEIFETILENQNAYIRSGETARSALDTKVTNAMRQLVNDDTALLGIDTKVTNAISQLDNDDSALTVIKDDVTSALAALNALANREYSYTHEAIVTDDLEKDYQSIITETPSLADVSAVGMLAILKDGDTVTAQGNRLFINGEEVVNPNGYTFSGTNSQDGIEVVKIWWFENNTPIDISSKADFAISELIIKTINYMPTIDNDYLNVPTVRMLGTYNGVVTTNNINHLFIINNSLTTIPTNIRSVYSSIETLPTNSGLGNKTALKSVYLPNLKTIMSNSSNNNYNGFRNNISLTDIYFPKLESIGDSDQWTGTFTNVPIINFPESVKTIGTAACVNNREIHMNCSKATNIKTNWCYGTPTVFTMVANWEATINISKAASNWQPEKFTTIPAVKDPTDTYYLYNLLRTVEYTPNAHVITIPQAYVSDDLIDAYMEIGWDLLGA